MPTTPLGIPTPADTVKISQLAAAVRAAADKIDEIMATGITDGMEQAAADAVAAIIGAPGFRLPGRATKAVAYGQLPNFTTSGTLSYPDGLRVIAGTDYYAVPAGTLDFSALLSTNGIVAILHDPATNALVAVGAAGMNATHASMNLIGVFTTGSSLGRTGWMSCRYTFNGTYTPENPYEVLHAFEVPGARVVPTMVNGKPTEIRHQINGSTVRYDTLTYAPGLITEVRSHIPSGTTITLTHNLTTYTTEITE